MHHALPMSVVQRRCHVASYTDRIVDGQLLFAAQPVAQRLPLDEWHDVIQQGAAVALHLSRVVKRQYVGVLQPGRYLDLAQEALRPDGGGQLGMQNLEGHLPAMLGVLREVDGRHPASPHLAINDIAPRQAHPKAVE